MLGVGVSSQKGKGGNRNSMSLSTASGIMMSYHKRGKV